jgi:hypothetical protein
MSYPVAIPTLPDLPTPDRRFFDAEHARILEKLGVALPFVPIDHERPLWCCDQCGRTRRFAVEIWSRWGGSVEFQPKILDGKSLVCKNLVYIRTYKVKGRWIGSGWRGQDEYEWNEQEYGPRGTHDPSAKFVRERPGPCPGSSWTWPEAKVAAEQIAFLSILPLWLEAHRALDQGDQFENDWMRNACPFPVEWMGGGYSTMALYHKLTRLESIVVEIVGRMNAAGHNLTFGSG